MKNSSSFWWVGLAILFAPVQTAHANGVSENRSWQFRSSADRTNDAFIVDMIERKKGGFYDAATTENITNIYGDQINCSLSPQATGSAATSVVDAVTSSPQVAPGSGFTSDAIANATENRLGDSDGALNNAQDNSGELSPFIGNNTATAGNTDGSGGTTDQILNNDQTNTGNQTAYLTDSQGCTFSESGTGTGGSPTAVQSIN